MAFDMFLEFTPIQLGGAGTVKLGGESQDKAHQGMVALKSFAFGLDNHQTVGSTTGGAGAGKAAFHPLSVSKSVDSTSPNLLLAGSSGDEEPQETVDFAYGALQLSYAVQSPTGQLSQTPLVTQWSQITNTPEFVVPGTP